MTYFLTIINFFIMTNSSVIFDFKNDSDMTQWQVVNDDVMGGVSKSTFYLNQSGHGVFEGNVSLENNGGFAMVMYAFDQKDIRNYSKAIIKLKGDGKKYQFRIKTNSGDYYSYITQFDTTGDWQVIEIELTDLYPSFRGRILDKPNYPKIKAEQIAFLISNKKEEQFKLELDSIELK